MGSNPLLDKWEEIYGQKEEPKPISRPSAYEPNRYSISSLEGLLRDLKSGKAVIVGNKKDDNYRYCSPISLEYINLQKDSYERNFPEIYSGYKITLEIFVKYD
jgi:hypothetical protein